MSADHWATCPNCAAEARDKCLALEKAVDAKYGNVAATEWQRLREECDLECAKITRAATESLREDYELGVRNGEFSIYFGAMCKMCRFQFEFTHKTQIDIEKAVKK